MVICHIRQDLMIIIVYYELAPYLFPWEVTSFWGSPGIPLKTHDKLSKTHDKLSKTQDKLSKTQDKHS